MTSIYDFSLENQNGEEIPLSHYQGKVLIVVNTATGCGLTPQYQGLQDLYLRYQEKGLEILDIPCNQVMGQAPGTAEEIIPRWYKEGYRADALIVDPPRTGLDDKLLDTIVKYAPEKMVYVSCNVSTLARDLVRLLEVYDLHYIQSVDMFPHTARTEAVVKLTKRKSSSK